MKKMHVVQVAWPAGLLLLIRRFTRCVWQDRVSVYAAQATFFTIISSVPLVSLLANIVKLILPTAAEREKITEFFTGAVPDSILELGVYLFEEVASSAAVPVLSISAVFVWWSAAKGVGAIREGVQTVYEAPRVRGYFRKMFSSILYTILFVVLIITGIAALLFGEFLLDLFQMHLPHLTPFFSRLMALKTPLFLILLTLIFSILYTAVSRRSSHMSRRFRDHIPGALCAALGWLGFSWIYSYYMNHASRPYLLYGNLTATCFIMLWLYFCMIILLCGAEINKMFFAKIR